MPSLAFWAQFHSPPSLVPAAAHSQPGMAGHWLSESVLAVPVGDPVLASELTQLSLQMLRVGGGLSRSNRGGWHSRYLEASREAPLAELRRRLEAPALAFLRRRAGGNASAASRGPRVRVASLWANAHGPGDSNVLHRHAEEGSSGEEVPVISGVYYAAGGARSAALHFPGPPELDVEPQPGTVVLFPSEEPHAVVARGPVDEGAPKPRISLSFNLVARHMASDLDEAACDGDLEALRRLAQGAAGSLDLPGPEGFSALHHAAESGHAAAVALLLEGRASPTRTTPAGATAIGLAAAAGHAAVVTRLLDWDAQAVHARSGALASTPTHAAAANGDLALLEMLAARGAQLGARRVDGGEPLHSAVLNGHAAAADFLLAKGAGANAADAAGLRPIHEAARGGVEDVARALLAARADPAAVDGEGRPPLYWAARGGHVALLELISTLAPTPTGKEVPAAASVEGSRGEAMAEYMAAALAGQGGDQQASPRELRPLHAAALEGHTAAARWLLAHGADKRTATASSRSQPVHMAASEGHAAVVQLLLDERVGVGEAARGRLEPLHLASLGGHLEMLSLLLRARASPDAAATDGGRPLHLAAGRGHAAASQRLLEAQADVAAATRGSRAGRKGTPNHPSPASWVGQGAPCWQSDIRAACYVLIPWMHCDMVSNVVREVTLGLPNTSGINPTN